MRQIPSDPDPRAAPAPHLAYRPEIDGLRAIAVLSVVLYHFGVPGLSGGFVGVDVFFVISGFLIGGLLWKELAETGRLRIGRFYLRRIRRLAPAFFAMALVSAMFAALVLLPFEFREFGKELIAATLWLSNVLFWRGAGYFDTGSESKVLLHTWSLSVEEQFYLVLPVTLLALWWLATRFPRGNRARTSRDVRRPVLAVLSLLWAVSLLACIALTPSDPVATFFLFPFRAWELLTGVLLAIHMQTRGAPRLHAALPWAGLALILAGVLLIRADGFPGWQALLPTIGTALVLAATGPHPALRALAHPVPVFVGLISYSLYLWHWPVLILSRYWRDGYSAPAEAAGWLALAILLAILSWAFVERPVRRARALGTPALLSGAVLAGGAALGLGGLAYVTDGLPARFGADVRPHILASQDFLQDWSRCTTADEGPFAGIETCALGPEGPPQVVVWGDSHLRALMDGLALAAAEEGTPGLLIWHAGCPPLFGLTKTESAATPAENAACTAANARMTEGLRALAPGRLLLVGRWTYYAEGAGVGRDVANTIALGTRAVPPGESPDQAALFGAALGDTVATLREMGWDVWLFRQVPEIADYDSRDVARRLAHGRLTPADASALTFANPERLASRVARAEAAIMPLVSSGAVTLIDPWPDLCPERCGAMQAGEGLYFDNNHLTNTGALRLRELFRPFLDGGAGNGTGASG